MTAYTYHSLSALWLIVLCTWFAILCPEYDYKLSVDQIDAHVGGVNDIAFAHPNKQLCIITCGDDKTIKVSFCDIINSGTVLYLV